MNNKSLLWTLSNILCISLPYLFYGDLLRLFAAQLLGFVVFICCSQYFYHRNLVVFLKHETAVPSFRVSRKKMRFGLFSFGVSILFSCIMLIASFLRSKFYMIMPLLSLLILFSQYFSLTLIMLDAQKKSKLPQR